MKHTNWIKAALAMGFILALLLVVDITLFNNPYALLAPVFVTVIWVVSALVAVTLLNVGAHHILTRRNLAIRQQAETALEEQQRFLLQIINANPNAIFVRDREGRYVLTNRIAAETVGRSVDKLIGTHEAETNADVKQVETFLTEDRRVMDTREPLFQSEMETQYPDGVTRWQQVSKLPLLDPDGTSNRVLVVLVDITRSKQAEEALLKSEAQYRAIIEDHPGFIYRYTLDYIVTFVNKAYCDFFGHAPEDILGRSLLDVISPEGLTNVERARQQIAKVTPQNPVNTHEHSVTNARGEQRWFRWTDRLIRNENGEPLEYQSSGLDITDRQQAEAALEEQHRFLRQVIDAIPSSIFVRDYDGRYLLVNNKTPFGAVETGTIVGENRERPHFTIDQVRHFLQEDRKVMDTGQELFTPEEELTLANGKKHWQSVSKLPLFDPDGTSKRVLVLLTDISERKKLEAGMVDADKLAGLGTLAAGIAHEINSPLQIITGKSESLQRRLAREQLDLTDLDKDLDSINRNAWRVARIVRSLLDYAHPLSEETTPDDINALIKDTLLLIEHQLKTWSNITVITDLASDLPLLQCSSEEISRLLINLLTNARDAMPIGGEITIRTRQDQANNSIILEVADTGQGIPEEIRSTIFNPFFTTKVVGKGTGLGLFIVHGIVQSYGGQITLDSQPDKGTTFTINLPQDPLPKAKDKSGRY